jgi:hypothetical protein
MPSIKLTSQERRENLCELCNRPADVYLVRLVAKSMFVCNLCVRPTS